MSKVSVLPLVVLVSVGTLDAESVCGTERPAVMSITVDMTLKDVQRRMGPGTLTARAPDPDADWQYHYSWRHGSARIDAVLDRDLKVAMVSISSRVQATVLDKVMLNRDTVESVERRLGPPVAKIGPAYGEGEYAFYSLVYRCGTEGDEVQLMTQLECKRPDMEACLSERLFLGRPIVKVAIRRRPKM